LPGRESAESMRCRLLASECGTIKKQGYHKLKVALASMTPYAVAMNNLGFQTVYRLFNEHPEVCCERVFRFDREEHGSVGEWLSVESGARLQDFDVLVVSLSYEQECLCLPEFLKAAGLPLFAGERWDGMPIIFCGGTVITSNPEPVAPFIDVCGIGDAEVLVRDFIRVWLEGSGHSWNRDRLLHELAAVAGFYVPVFYNSDSEGGLALPGDGPEKQGVPDVVERQSANLGFEPAHSVVVSEATHFAGMYLVEVARGCRWGCRFCLVCSINRPYRSVDAQRVIRLIEERPEAAGSVGLVGANLCDHPELESILSRVAGLDLRLGASSLRLDTVSDSLLIRLRDCGVRTVTLAPEAATAELLASIGKHFSPDRLPEVAQLVGRAGFDKLKLYYMIGLPGEQESDRLAIVEQVRQIREILPKKLRLKISLNPFVPKPQTPFQNEPMAEVSLIKSAIRTIRRGLAAIEGPGVRLQTPAVAESLAQAAISLGDRRIAKAIERACLYGERFLDALAAVGVDTDSLLHGKEGRNRPHPWRVVEQKECSGE
jgi:radical SAM superfamily enzyme YgiQ (UPF0313 family)